MPVDLLNYQLGAKDLTHFGFRRRHLPLRATRNLQGHDISDTPGWHMGFNIPAFLSCLLTVVLVREDCVSLSNERNDIVTGEDHGDPDRHLLQAELYSSDQRHSLLSQWMERGSGDGSIIAFTYI